MKSISLVISLTTIILFASLAMASVDTQALKNKNIMANKTQDLSQHQQPERDLLGWLVVLNNTEIAVSKEVLTRKSLNPLVKEFAKFMVSQHTMLLKDTMNTSKKMHLIPDETSDKAVSLQKEGHDGMDKLKSIDDQGINKAYIDAMVQGHQEALSALQSDLKDEKNPALKALLTTTAHAVGMHLKKAQAVQKKLGA